MEFLDFFYGSGTISERSFRFPLNIKCLKWEISLKNNKDIYAAKLVPFFFSSHFLVFPFLCLFPEAAISYISFSVAGGWLGLTFIVCVCLCICQHSVYFQSILFKDQTRGWWLIFLSLALSFISLGNEGGDKRKRGGVRHLHKPRSNVHIPSTRPPLPLLLSPRGLTTLLRSSTETDLA